jgi:4-amino-4-deoxy-L-arabinose transferase-like glycosyltransferase
MRGTAVENPGTVPAQAAAGPALGPGLPRRWKTALLAGGILVVSLAIRIPNLGAPPLDLHNFRQTQTAITVQAYLDHGLDLFHYETPVFGPPWQVTYEFPTFQASAYAVARTGLALDLACRMTGLLWFYASAILLFVIVRRVADDTAAIAALALYVLSPFSIQWSRACLIDYASVALTLGYLLAAMSWAARPRAWKVLAAIALGALAFVTKITTVVAVLPAMAIVTVGALRRDWAGGAAARVRWVVSVGAMAALPLGAGIAWTRWADGIKAASPATEWLTSSRLAVWNFGTLPQRLVLENWLIIARRMSPIVPGIFALALACAALAFFRRRRGTRLALLAAVASALAPILTFFNLYYVHDYYLIAVTPGLALVAGVGIAELASLRLPARRVTLGVAALAALVTSVKAFRYARDSYKDLRREPIVSLARVIGQVTPQDGWIVVEGDDWNSRIPYLAHRRAFMVKPPVVSPRLIADRPEVKTLVCFTCPAEFLALWPDREWLAREADADVFRASAPKRAR